MGRSGAIVGASAGRRRFGPERQWRVEDFPHHHELPEPPPGAQRLLERERRTLDRVRAGLRRPLVGEGCSSGLRSRSSGVRGRCGLGLRGRNGARRRGDPSGHTRHPPDGRCLNGRGRRRAGRRSRLGPLGHGGRNPPSGLSGRGLSSQFLDLGPPPGHQFVPSRGGRRRGCGGDRRGLRLRSGPKRTVRGTTRGIGREVLGLLAFSFRLPLLERGHHRRHALGDDEDQEDDRPEFLHEDSVSAPAPGEAIGIGVPSADRSSSKGTP